MVILLIPIFGLLVVAFWYLWKALAGTTAASKNKKRQRGAGVGAGSKRRARSSR